MSPLAGTVEPTVETVLRGARKAVPPEAAAVVVAATGAAEAVDFDVVPLLELPQPAIASAATGTANDSFQVICIDPLIASQACDRLVASIDARGICYPWLVAMTPERSRSFPRGEAPR
jgi:hypothetical protein